MSKNYNPIGRHQTGGAKHRRKHHVRTKRESAESHAAPGARDGGHGSACDQRPACGHLGLAAQGPRRRGGQRARLRRLRGAGHAGALRGVDGHQGEPQDPRRLGRGDGGAHRVLAARNVRHHHADQRLHPEGRPGRAPDGARSGRLRAGRLLRPHRQVAAGVGGRQALRHRQSLRLLRNHVQPQQVLRGRRLELQRALGGAGQGPGGPVRLVPSQHGVSSPSTTATRPPTT